MNYSKILKIVIAAFTTMTMITLSSCNFLGNSVGPHSDELIGEWVRQYSSHIPGEDLGLGVRRSGFTSSTEVRLILEKGGQGKVLNKSITVFESNDVGDHSNTVEFPIKWETQNNGQEDFLIIKYGAGKIADMQAENKLKEEQNAAITINAYSGMSDTTYFSIQEDKTIKWHIPNSTEEYRITKW
jgi:hypothetical protein